MKKHIHPNSYSGTIHIPSSKSDGQRALLAAALAKGESFLHNAGNSNDETAMQEAIQVLGAKVEMLEERELKITGIERFPENAELDMHESGLGIRLITSVCAAHKGEFTLTGSGSLRKRPMDFFEKTLPEFGVEIKTTNGFVPFSLTGPMQGSQVILDGSQSSQYLSGLLMALPLLSTESRLEVQNLKSVPYVQMTLNTLAQFGIDIRHANFEQFVIAENQHYLATEYTIEGDWSSASYWLVASALGQEIAVSGLSLQSLQADKAILHAFENANCVVEFDGDNVSIDGTERTPFVFDATHCPDLFPALVTLASLCDGRSDIKGVHRLLHKESNRGEVLKAEFEKLGVNIVLNDDTMHIYGKTSIEGGTVSANNDHRIAMCLAIAGMFADTAVEIDEAESVAKSYLDFWSDLEKLQVHSSGK